MEPYKYPILGNPTKSNFFPFHFIRRFLFPSSSFSFQRPTSTTTINNINDNEQQPATPPSLPTADDISNTRRSSARRRLRQQQRQTTAAAPALPPASVLRWRRRELHPSVRRRTTQRSIVGDSSGVSDANPIQRRSSRAPVTTITSPCSSGVMLPSFRRPEPLPTF